MELEGDFLFRTSVFKKGKTSRYDDGERRVPYRQCSRRRDQCSILLNIKPCERTKVQRKGRKWDVTGKLAWNFPASPISLEARRTGEACKSDGFGGHAAVEVG